MATSIEWTKFNGEGFTWNPIVSGCRIISEGCSNCYAMNMAKRLEAMGQEKYKGLTRKTASGKVVWNGEVRINMDDPKLLEPLHRKKASTYFVNSMTDLFQDGVPFEAIDKIMAVIALTPQHTYQLLTKRPERMREYFDRLQTQKPTLHKCEDNDDISGITYFRNELPAKHRIAPCNKSIDHLINFRSPDSPNNPVYLITDPFMELKSLINLYGQDQGQQYYKELYENQGKIMQSVVFNLPFPNLWLGVSVENQEQADKRIPFLLETPAAVRFLSIEPLLEKIDLGLMYEVIKIRDIDWVIVGGESGKKARPMHPDWVRSIRDQCQEAGVPFFFKQWGEWVSSSPKYLIGYIKEHSREFMQDWDIPESGFLTTNLDTYVYEKGQNIPKILQKVGKAEAGNLLDGKTYQEFPKL